MPCDKCQKNQATTQTISIVDGAPALMNLCEECFGSSQGFALPNFSGMTALPPITIEGVFPQGGMPSSINIPANFMEILTQGILGAMNNMPKPSSQQGMGKAPSAKAFTITLPCPACGLSFEEFKNSLKLGCAECYQAFAENIENYLKTLQSSTRHEGKIPKRSGILLQQKREIERLRDELKRAVEAENFEEAARLRDQIKTLEVQ